MPTVAISPEVLLEALRAYSGLAWFSGGPLDALAEAAYLKTVKAARAAGLIRLDADGHVVRQKDGFTLKGNHWLSPRDEPRVP